MFDFASLSTFVYAVTVLRATLGQTATKFRFPCGPQDCADAACWNDTREWPTLNHPVSERFFPTSKQGESKEAICDHLHAATLVVRRNRDLPSVSFERTWQDYENGFGVSGNHWLGLKHLHRLSSRGHQMISLIYGTKNGKESHVLDGAWDNFTVDSAFNLYKLYLGPSRNSIDVMQSAKGQPFYNRYRTKARGKLRCGSRFSGSWWFGSCSGRRSDLINLNGQFNVTDADKSVFIGTHVVISAEIRMQPFLYESDNYTCDKTCPNGGTCQQASDKASYFCRCLPTFTGRRCDSQVLSGASSASVTSSNTTMTKAQTLVKPTSSIMNMTKAQTLVNKTSSITNMTKAQTLVNTTSSITNMTKAQTLVKPTSSITRMRMAHKLIKHTSSITTRRTAQTLVKPTSAITIMRMRMAHKLIKHTSSITKMRTAKTLVKPTSSVATMRTAQTLVTPNSSITAITSTTKAQTRVKATSSITAPTSKPMAQTLVKLTYRGTDTVLYKRHSQVYVGVMFISIAVSTTICLMLFYVGSEIAIWEYKRYKAYQNHNYPYDYEIPLLQGNTYKRHGKGTRRHRKQKHLSEESDKTTWDNTTKAKSIITIRSQREEDMLTGESVTASRSQTNEIPTDSRRKRDTSAEDETQPRHKKKHKSKKNEGPDYHPKRTSSIKRTALKTN